MHAYFAWVSMRQPAAGCLSPAPLGTAHTSTAGRWRQVLRRYRRCPLLCQKCPLLELHKGYGSRRVGCVAKHRIGAPSRPRTRATGSSGSLSDTSADRARTGERCDAACNTASHAPGASESSSLLELSSPSPCSTWKSRRLYMPRAGLGAGESGHGMARALGSSAIRRRQAGTGAQNEE